MIVKTYIYKSLIIVGFIVFYAKKLATPWILVLVEVTTHKTTQKGSDKFVPSIISVFN